MKFEKKSAYYANEESFKIYDGSTLLFTSPVFANHENRVIEKCLSSSTNKQYKIELLDSYGDSWTTGSRLTVYGLYGNAVFKNMILNGIFDVFYAFSHRIPHYRYFFQSSFNSSFGIEIFFGISQ